MRIVIDTKHDSPEEIRHAINMLTAMIGETAVSNKHEERKDDIFGNIFGAKEAEATDSAEKKETDSAEKKEENEAEEIDEEKEGMHILAQQEKETRKDYLEKVKDFNIDELETY